jgi:hypothetical protein
MWRAAEMRAEDPELRILLMEKLASAIRHVEDGQDLIRRQRDRIYALGKAGRNTALAELVLARLEASQSLRVADRERVEDLLAAQAS